MSSLRIQSLVSAMALTVVVSLSLRAAEPATPPADAPKAPPKPAGERYEAMREQRDAWIKELGVSDEQRGKIQAALKEQAEKGRELRADTALSDTDRRAKMKELRDGTTAKLKTILTPEQFTKYEQLQAQRRERPANRGEGAKPQPDAPKPNAAPPAKPAKPAQ